MSVRRQLLLARWAVFALCALAIFATTRVADLPVSWLLAVGLLAGVRPVQRRANRFIAHRAFVKLYGTMNEERFEDAHALLGDLRRVYARSASALELLRVHEGSVLVLEGRFVDAARLLDSVDRRKLEPALVPWFLNNLAWALARGGEGARAVTIARESIDASGASGDVARTSEDLRACQLGTLGAALFVAGQPGDAIDPLEQAIARGGAPRHQAARGFYLGEALHALGREDEARTAWKRASEAAPSHDLGRRARDRLEGATTPYRA